MLQNHGGDEPTKVQRIAYDEISDTGSDIHQICLEGDYVVLCLKPCLIVWDWKEEKLTEIILVRVLCVTTG